MYRLCGRAKDYGCSRSACGAQRTMIQLRERFLGAMFGLAYGDAMGFPALFHRFQAAPRKRHGFLWRTNMELDNHNITRLMLPYTHRLPSIMLEPCPTDAHEFSLLTLRARV